MIDYILIILLQILGIGFQAWVKILELDKKFEDDSLNDVINQFWRSDKITLFISIWIIGLNLVAHYIIEEYSDLSMAVSYYPLINFAIAFVLGYAGQKIVYKYLGKAETVLMRKADKLDNL